MGKAFILKPPNVGVTRAERAQHARERRGEAEGASGGRGVGRADDHDDS